MERDTTNLACSTLLILIVIWVFLKLEGFVEEFDSNINIVLIGYHFVDWLGIFCFSRY